MNRMASIRIVDDIQPIIGADSIEHARIGGWWVVVKKNTVSVGKKVVFFSIDSVLPDAEWCSFLKDKRLRTVKLRGALSQGLVLPVVDVFGKEMPELQDMDDVSEILGVKHYEKESKEFNPKDQHNNMIELGHRPFPGYIRKTDEERIQNIPDIVNVIVGEQIYITTKCDGTSATFSMLDGDLNVCGRNWSLKQDPSSVYWQMFEKYGIGEILAKNNGIAIQGEIVGPGIQKNRMKLNETRLMVFDVFDIKKNQYYGVSDLLIFCDNNGMEMVPIDDLFTVSESRKKSMDEWLETSKGFYPGTTARREGIVVRSTLPKDVRMKGYCGRLSFKVINNEYLLKDED